MSKEIKFKSRMDNVPDPKKPKKKLGLMSRNKVTQPLSFRLRPEVVDAFNEMVLRLNRQSRIRLSKTAVMELCILHADERTVEELIEFYNANIV